MLAKTHDYAGKNKRSKPRRQSGDAVKGMQKEGSSKRLDEYQVEKCDQDLQRMRRKCLLLDVDNVLRKANISHNSANEDTSCASSTAASVGDHFGAQDGSWMPANQKRSKRRRQSGNAVAHLNGICQESLEIARAAARLENFDPDCKPKATERRASVRPSLSAASE